MLAPQGSLLDLTAGNQTTLTWKAGWWLRGLADWRRVTVQRDFNLGGGGTVKAGVYDMNRVGFGLGSPWVRTLGANVTFRARDFFGGTMLEAVPSLILRPGGLLRIEVGGAVQQVDIREAGADYLSVLLNGRAAIGFSPELNLDLYAGWSRVASRIPVQARLRWTWRRASDLFVVYQADFLDDDGSVTFQSLMAKVTMRYP